MFSLFFPFVPLQSSGIRSTLCCDNLEAPWVRLKQRAHFFAIKLQAQNQNIVQIGTFRTSIDLLSQITLCIPTYRFDLTTIGLSFKFIEHIIKLKFEWAPDGSTVQAFLLYLPNQLIESILHFRKVRLH